MIQSTIHRFSIILLACFMQTSSSYPTFVNPEAHLGNSNGYQLLHGSISPLVSNDHHGGVSIVGAGGSASRGTTIDLTKQGGDGHNGLFGGSFISSGAHGKSGGYFQGGGAEHIHLPHSGLASYASPLSSYDVGSHHTKALIPVSDEHDSSDHDAGEISPVLYSSYNDAHGQHFPLHGSGFGLGGLHGGVGSEHSNTFDSLHGYSNFGH